MRNFDHNATHPLSAAARAAWLDAVERFPANPSSPHRWGARAATALDEAREKVAGWLGCRPEDVVWTSGATEANNAVIQHLAATTTGKVLISALEHPSVRVAAKRWLTDRLEEIPVSRDGMTDALWVGERLEGGDVGAVVIMGVNNETGVFQPGNVVRDIIRPHSAIGFCDAAQWIGKMPCEDLAKGIFLTACAHKFGGPQGVGFMVCPPNFRPLLVGGPQEDGRRAGTENVAGVLAMVAALEERQAILGDLNRSSPALKSRLTWRDRFIADLKATLPGVEIVGEGAGRLWNTVAALMPAAADCRRRWVVKLDKLGFAVSTGSACASGKEQPSHVLAAMGYRPAESDRMLRFSAGWETTEEDWRALLDAILQAAAELKTG